MRGMKLKRIDKIGLFFLVAFIISWWLLQLFEKSFDQQEWKTNPLERYEMVDDLIESQLLIGKSEGDVISILGKPNSAELKQSQFFVYEIGEEPSFFKNQTERLVVIFKNNKVEKVSLAVE